MLANRTMAAPGARSERPDTVPSASETTGNADRQEEAVRDRPDPPPVHANRPERRPGNRDDQQSRRDNRDDNKDDDHKSRSRWPLIILGIIVVVAVIAAVVYWLMTRGQVSTDDAYTEGNAIAFAPKVSGYVTQLNVDDNTF